jgi:predicted transcriptional regulator
MSEGQGEWTKTTFRLPKAVLKSVKHFATDHEMTDTDVFNAALREYLEREGKKSAKGR